MPEPVSSPRFSPQVWAVALTLAGVTGAGQDTFSPPVKLATLPERFFQIQDEAGFLWQALDNGALISGDTQYLQSGLNLIVDGQPFLPTAGSVREPGSGGERIDIRLSETRESLTLERDLWFDTRRSAVRVLDTVTNRAGRELDLEIVLRTTYPFAWQSLHGTGGGVLGNDPAPVLRPGDVSLGIHFSPIEGRHDTFVLFGSARGGDRPELKSSANSRELLLTYRLAVPANQSRSLLHWILQRNLPGMAHDLAALNPLIQRDQLIQPGIDPKLHTSVVNFAAAAFPAETAAPTGLRALVALNELTDRFGFQRRSEDLLWSGPTSQLAGVLQREGSLSVETVSLGKVDVPIAEIAAIRGGAGGGLPQFFLRDGRVLSGSMAGGRLAWMGQAAAGEADSLLPEEFHLLLLATAPQDGTPPPGTTHFVQLVRGSVLAATVPAETPFGWISAAAGLENVWGDLVECERRQTPWPHWRLRLQDGSILAVMPPEEAMSVPLAGGGQIEIRGGTVERIWRAGEAPEPRTGESDVWLDFAELPPELVPATGFLLEGNQILAGDFAESELTLLDGGRPITVASSRISAVFRPLEAERAESFRIELAGGETLTGVPVAATIPLRTAGGVCEVPWERLLEYRKIPAPR